MDSIFSNHLYKSKMSSSINKILSSLLFLGLGLSSAALTSQELSETDTPAGPPTAGIGEPPEVSLTDAAGVDILSGQASFRLTDLKIGSGVSQLSHTIASEGEGFFWGFWEDYRVKMDYHGGQPSSYYKFSYGHQTEIFSKDSDDNYTPIKGNGSTYVGDGDPNTLWDTSFTFTNSMGVTVTKEASGAPVKIMYPNGFEVTIHGGTGLRTRSVTTNTGLQLFYEYESDVFDDSKLTVASGTYPYNTFDSQYKLYTFPTKITALNNTVDYCDPSANDCTFSRTWPHSQYSWPTWGEMFGYNGTGVEGATFSATDYKGAVTAYKHKQYIMRKPDQTPEDKTDTPPNPFRDHEGYPRYNTRVYEVKQGTSASNVTTEIDYDDVTFKSETGSMGSTYTSYSVRNTLAVEARVNGEVYTYKYYKGEQYRSFGDGISPRGTINGVMALGAGIPLLVSKRAPEQYLYYDWENLSNRVEFSEQYGQRIEYKYTRDNVSEKKLVVDSEKPNQQVYTDIVWQAGYDEVCSNIKKCNKPNWIKDGRGKQTDYQYHPITGQVTKVTLPAANEGGVRPETRYLYQPLTARYIQSVGGAIENAPSPVYMLVGESSCQTGAASGDGCADSSDEVYIQYQYDDNLFLKGVITKADGKAHKTCYVNNALGQAVSESSSRVAIDLATSPEPSCQDKERHNEVIYSIQICLRACSYLGECNERYGKCQRFCKSQSL